MVSEGFAMKGWDLLIWIPQFGISVAAPIVLFILLANWLHNSCGWGSWVIIAGVIFGLITAAIGFRDTVTAMLQISGHKKKEPEPKVFFNSHQ